MERMDSLTQRLPFLRHNDPHHGVAGVDVDFKTDWPPPLPCMRWFADSRYARGGTPTLLFVLRISSTVEHECDSFSKFIKPF